jgi:hypothetical protein
MSRSIPSRRLRSCRAARRKARCHSAFHLGEITWLNNRPDSPASRARFSSVSLCPAITGIGRRRGDLSARWVRAAASASRRWGDLHRRGHCRVSLWQRGTAAVSGGRYLAGSGRCSPHPVSQLRWGTSAPFSDHLCARTRALLYDGPLSSSGKLSLGPFGRPHYRHSASVQ